MVACIIKYIQMTSNSSRKFGMSKRRNYIRTGHFFKTLMRRMQFITKLLNPKYLTKSFQETRASFTKKKQIPMIPYNQRIKVKKTNIVKTPQWGNSTNKIKRCETWKIALVRGRESLGEFLQATQFQNENWSVELELKFANFVELLNFNIILM